MDTREPKKVREYSEDEEGRLLREFDIAANDSAVTRAEIEQIVEALRKERERVRQERRDALNTEIQNARSRQKELAQELREGQEVITLAEKEILEKIGLEEKDEQARITSKAQEEQERIAREAEKTRNQLMVELQEERKQIEANIQSKKDKAEKAMAKFEEVNEEATVHAKTLTLYKNPSSKVYTAAKEELEKCMKSAKTSQRRVKKLAREISHLEQDLGEVDKLLERLDDSKEMDEVSKQEDEMWEQYRAEQEKERAELEEQKESDDKKFEEAIKMQQEMQQWNEDWQNDMAAREAEDVVNAGYADGLNPGMAVLDKEEPQAPQIPTATQTPTQPQNPQNPQQPTQPPKPKKPDSPKQPLNTNFEVKTVGLMIEDDGKPRYYAIMYGKDGQEITVKSKEKGGFEDISTITEELRTELTAKGIYQPDKYYDAGLDNFLVELDTMYGRMQKSPSGSMRPIDRDAYVTMIAQKDMMVGKKPIPFEVSYDLSNLYRMPETAEGKNRLKGIKKIARANSNQGLATYEKAPGIFKRLMRALKMKSLPKAKASEELDSLEEMLCSQYRSRYRDRDFDPYAISDITREEADIIAKDAARILEEEDRAISMFKHRTKLEREERDRVNKMSFIERVRDIPSSMLNKIKGEEPNGTSIGPRSRRYESKEREPGDE